MPIPNSRPSREEVLMQIAQVTSKRGTCSRAQVGVVIANEGRILVSGYNGAPSGLPHCDHSMEMPGHIAPPGKKGGCTTAVHGEANAIAWAARQGVALDGADLFTTLTPCLACAQLIVNAGIKKVYYSQKYRLDDGMMLLDAAGVGHELVVEWSS